MPIGRGFAEKAVHLVAREGARLEPDRGAVRLLVDRDVEDGGDLLERVTDERGAALTARLLDFEDRRLHDRQPSVVTLGAVQVEILYCPT
jgi:hypothetical protein